ncbi:MAG TPA: T9SS type A sorting domain-containing protein [Chitinophagaceae bacterium]|nr:T9SS type A sorting domain-containing protein [Chitinophagaceae bacterium]
MVKLYAYLLRISAALLFLFSTLPLSAQTSCPGFPNMVQSKRPNINIGTYIKGFLEYLPPGYTNPGPEVYPLIIYFHGVGEVGNGSSSDLCKLLSLLSDGSDNNAGDVPLPERIERGELPSVTDGGKTYNYIVLSPQYNQYNYPGAYPSAADVSAMIDYAVANYKVDISRIYLTGMSSGANMVMEYAATSLANAQRVAAIGMASLCARVGNFPNGPANIANADLAVWEVHCATDDFTDGVPPDGDCHDSLSTNWINRINTSPSPPTPLAKKTTLPIAGWPCNTGFTHNTWNTFYNPAFVVDGRNIYTWLIQFDRDALLPANLRNYTAILRGGKVYVEWTTTSETNTDRFILERANASGQYQQVATVAAAGTSGVAKKYVLIDDQPLKGINLYRLALVNRDGSKEYYDVKRVSLPNTSAGYITIPGPVKGTLSVYVNVDRAQNVRISVHDLNGRSLHRSDKLVAPGLTENKINVSALPSGTYFVKVEGEHFSESRKVVIN